MQMDNDLPVHLNVYISMFKQLVTCEKVQNYPVGFTTESLPLDVTVMQLLTAWWPQANLLVTVFSVVGEGVGEVTWTNK